MHKVKVNFPELELGKADIGFKVKRNAAAFGELRVSKGSLVWFPKDTSYGNKITWLEFDSIMKTKRREEKRSRNQK